MTNLLQQYAIETIAIAPKRYGRNVYPFAEMKVNQSFKAKDNTFEEVQRIRGAISSWQKKHKPMKFSLQKDKNGDYHCWRIA